MEKILEEVWRKHLFLFFSEGAFLKSLEQEYPALCLKITIL
jgi:hypothetical protein